MDLLELCCDGVCFQRDCQSRHSFIANIGHPSEPNANKSQKNHPTTPKFHNLYNIANNRTRTSIAPASDRFCALVPQFPETPYPPLLCDRRKWKGPFGTAWNGRGISFGERCGLCAACRSPTFLISYLFFAIPIFEWC